MGGVFLEDGLVMGNSILAGESAFVKVLKALLPSAPILLSGFLLAACSTSPDALSSRDLSREAHKALLAGDLSRAVHLDKEALARSPNDLAPMNNMAVALDRSGKKKEAEGILLAALHMHPDSPVLLLNLARIELSLGQAGTAYIYASRIISQDSWPGGFRTLMGKIDIDRGNYQEAHIYLHEAQERHPDNPLILTYLGIVHYRLGELSEAKKNFHSALRRHPAAGLARTLHSLLRDPQRVLGQARRIDHEGKRNGVAQKKGGFLPQTTNP